MQLRFVSLLVGAALALGCGDDDGDGDDSAEDMFVATEDSGPGGDDLGPPSEDDMGPPSEDDMGPPSEDDMGSGETEAEEFCGRYESLCGYDSGDAMSYDDEAACIAYYEAASMGCLSCIRPHLMNVETMGTSHCPHALGFGPCNGACP